MDRAVAAGARALARGDLVAHPTDTLFALAARASDRAAVARLLRAKGRSSAQRLSVSVSSLEELESWGRFSLPARAFVRRHLPGPWTVLVRPTPRARRELAPAVAGGPLLGLRIPDHPVARELARRAGPITATSANRSGEPPATTVSEARAALHGTVSVYVDGLPRPSGRPSVLVDLTGASPRVRSRR